MLFRGELADIEKHDFATGLRLRMLVEPLEHRKAVGLGAHRVHGGPVGVVVNNVMKYFDLRETGLDRTGHIRVYKIQSSFGGESRRP